ncbi:MBL fold metallo-hydrolase [Candidatus Thorarchaeota archaeon]|nr:MAG: MBL fold metallo-hydrolase [Candidatus Thorarchaeota archaeon]
MQGKAVQITPEIYTIIGGKFPLCNSVLVISDQVSIIDPGCRLEDLRTFLHTKNLEQNDIDNIVLSHIHPDHITHAARLKRVSDCKIWANEITAPLFDDKEKMKNFLGFHPGHKIRPFWEAMVNNKMYGALDESEVDYILADRERFSLGGIEGTTLFTPGHTPDHMCIEFAESNYIFGADIDCTDFGPYYGHPNSSIEDFKRSISLVMSKSYEGLISGHLLEPIVRDHVSALKSYRMHFDLREDFILMRISKGARSIDEIMEEPIIYKSLSDFVLLQFERWMVEHHLNSLIQKELVRNDNGIYRTIRA